MSIRHRSIHYVVLIELPAGLLAKQILITMYSIDCYRLMRVHRYLVGHFVNFLCNGNHRSLVSQSNTWGFWGIELPRKQPGRDTACCYNGIVHHFWTCSVEGVSLLDGDVNRGVNVNAMDSQIEPHSVLYQLYTGYCALVYRKIIADGKKVISMNMFNSI